MDPTSTSATARYHRRSNAGDDRATARRRRIPRGGCAPRFPKLSVRSGRRRSACGNLHAQAALSGKLGGIDLLQREQGASRLGFRVSDRAGPCVDHRVSRRAGKKRAPATRRSSRKIETYPEGNLSFSENHSSSMNSSWPFFLASRSDLISSCTLSLSPAMKADSISHIATSAWAM